METIEAGIDRKILIAVYGYLALPMLIFVLGWCRWYIGVPAAIIITLGIILSVREYGPVKEKFNFSRNELLTMAAIMVMVVVWTAFSGIGGYLWQNFDHKTRNTLFEMLVNTKWPVAQTIETGGSLQSRGLIYYIGYWFPSALVGKLFGVEAGYAMQFIWTVTGILLLYALICCWCKKIVIWPLVVFMFFSGLDYVGALLGNSGTMKIFESDHLEAWSIHYQFSSITTQLFWVFNQAVPVWLACALIFLGERPKNMIFTWSLILLTSAFPFVGLLPYVIYYMITRASWRSDYHKVRHILMDCIRNWCSWQNLLAGGTVGAITALYLWGNEALGNSINAVILHLKEMDHFVLLLLLGILLCIGVFWLTAFLIMHGKGRFLKNLAWISAVLLAGWKMVSIALDNGQPVLFNWVNLTLFFFLEAGVFLVCLYPMIKSKTLFWITTVWLYVMPLIVIGNSCDFCMRASIPGLLLIYLWCIQVLNEKKEKLRVVLLIILLLLGSITPLHEIRRTYVESRNYYERAYDSEYDIYNSGNFAGSTDSFFWKYIAGPFER